MKKYKFKINIELESKDLDYEVIKDFAEELTENILNDNLNKKINIINSYLSDFEDLNYDDYEIEE